MSDRATYWLVNTGTSADPWVSRPIARYRQWNKIQGPVQGFSARPSGIAVGDVLIHRAVGSAGDRLIAVARVTGSPSQAGNGQWPWLLPRQLTYVCPSLDVAPRAAEVGIEAEGMRTYRKLDADAGRRAETAIAASGHSWTD